MCPKVNFEEKAFKKIGTLHVMLIYITTSMFSFWSTTFFLLTFDRFGTLIEKTVIIFIYLLIVILMINIMRNRTNEDFKTLMVLVIQYSDNRYWKIDSVRSNHILVQFLTGNAIYLVTNLISIVSSVLMFHRENLFAITGLKLFSQYLIFLNTSLWFCLIWSINNNYNGIILSLRQLFPTETFQYRKSIFLILKEVQTKYRNTAKMIKLLDNLFGKIIFWNVALSALSFLYLLVMFKYIVKENIMTTLKINLILVSILGMVIIVNIFMSSLKA